jgi:hypothetical protein
MDSKYEELRDTDTDRKTENDTVSYTDCDKEQYISCRASGFWSCHLICERFVLIKSFSSSSTVWRIGMHAASVSILPGPGGNTNLLTRRFKLISHDPISRSAISVRKHCSRILGVETGDLSLRPFGIIYLAGIGLECVPWLVTPPMSCRRFS